MRVHGPSPLETSPAGIPATFPTRDRPNERIVNCTVIRGRTIPAALLAGSGAMQGLHGFVCSGWRAAPLPGGRSNPLDRYERFQLDHPPFLIILTLATPQLKRVIVLSILIKATMTAPSLFRDGDGLVSTHRRLVSVKGFGRRIIFWETHPSPPMVRLVLDGA